MACKANDKGAVAEFIHHRHFLLISKLNNFNNKFIYCKIQML